MPSTFRLRPCVKVQWTSAGKGIDLRVLESFNHPLNSRISTQTCRCQCATCYNDIENVHVPFVGEETFDISADTTIGTFALAGNFIEFFPFTDGVLLHDVCQMNDGRERVAELDNTEGGDY